MKEFLQLFWWHSGITIISGAHNMAGVHARGLIHRIVVALSCVILVTADGHLDTDTDTHKVTIEGYGSALTLTCGSSSTGHPVDSYFRYWLMPDVTTQVRWSPDDEGGEHWSEHGVVLMANWSLFIPEVGPDHVGTYHCVVTTDEDLDVFYSTTVRLNVWPRYRQGAIVGGAAAAGALVVLSLLFFAEMMVCDKEGHKEGKKAVLMPESSGRDESVSMEEKTGSSMTPSDHVVNGYSTALPSKGSTSSYPQYDNGYQGNGSVTYTATDDVTKM